MWTMRAGRTTLRDPTEDRVLSTVRGAVSAGRGEIWIEHQHGAVLGLVLAGTRTMVLRLAEAGDAGFHAVDPGAAPGAFREYPLTNGQIDRYDDRDTVEARHVVPIVAHFLATTERWPGVAWQDDNEV